MVRVPFPVEAFNGPFGAVGAPPGPAEVPRAGYVGDGEGAREAAGVGSGLRSSPFSRMERGSGGEDLVRHHPIRLGRAMRQREHGPTTPPDVQLQDDMGAIASHAPGSFPRGRGREQRRDHVRRRLGRLEPRARGATAPPGLLHEIRRTDLTAAIAARGLMRSTGGLAAHWTGAHLVRCEDGLQLGHARRAVLFAHEPARPVSPAQVPGTLNLFVHGTHGLVRGSQ